MIKEKIGICINELKQKLKIRVNELKQKKRYWLWHQKVKLHRFISRIRTWIQEKILNILGRIEDWAHDTIDKYWDKLYDDDEPQIDDMVEGDTLG